MSKKISIDFFNLGCFKNDVDLENLLGMLQERGAEIVAEQGTKADWLIINTCGFIQTAKEQSNEAIADAIENKKNGLYKHIAVCGCFSQRYSDELSKILTNVDIIWGVNKLEILADLIVNDKREKYISDTLSLYTHQTGRLCITIPAFTYLKVSEGCNMQCAFCAIPMIRGDFRSRTIESLVDEAALLKESGFKELNIISQNSSYYGVDINKKSMLPKLINEISKIGFDWVRVLYLMPEEINDELFVSFENKNTLPYFDIPFQHVSPKILKLMNRGVGDKMELVKKIRKNFPESVIRTTFITGFPGETKEDFEMLKTFCKESEIERIGAFSYSDEEDTLAFNLNDKVNEEIAIIRKEEIMDISDENIQKYNGKILGSTKEFLPCGPCPWDENSTIGRITSQAPEVDGFTVVSEAFRDDYSPFKIIVKDANFEQLYGERK